MTATENELLRCPIFQGMSPDEFKEVLILLQEKSFAEGENILEEGKSVQNLWIVSQGRCEVVKATEGREHRLSTLEPLSVFGEMSFFNPAPHSASVRTLTDVDVYYLSRDQYDLLLHTGSSAAQKIVFNTARVLADRLRRMDEWIRECVQKNVQPSQRVEWLEFRAKLYTNWQF